MTTRMPWIVGAVGLFLSCHQTASMSTHLVAGNPGSARAAGMSGQADASVGSRSANTADAASPLSGDPTTVLHIVAAGDVACDSCSQGVTAALIDQLLSTERLAGVLILGDLAYPNGSATDFQSFYAPAWGRPEILRISHPVLGNHEYATGSAKDYFDYFNGAGSASGPAGPRDEGYYSFDLGSWHLIGLNTSDQCQFVSCDQTSAQHDWLAPTWRPILLPVRWRSGTTLDIRRGPRRASWTRRRPCGTPSTWRGWTSCSTATNMATNSSRRSTIPASWISEAESEPSSSALAAASHRRLRGRNSVTQYSGNHGLLGDSSRRCRPCLHGFGAVNAVLVIWIPMQLNSFAALSRVCAVAEGP